MKLHSIIPAFAARMRRNPFLLAGFLSTLFFVGAPTAAHAQTYTMDYSFQGGGNYNLATSQGAINGVAAGYLNASFHLSPGQNAPVGYPGTFRVYCVDLQHYEMPQTTVTLQSIPSAANEYATQRLQRAAWLYNKYGTTAAGEDSQALQLSIWKVLDGADGEGDITTGVFRVTSGLSDNVRLKANAYLADFLINPAAHLGSATLFRVSPLVRRTTEGQDMIGPTALAPEPASLLMVLPGIAPLGLLLRRRKRMG